MSVNWKMGKNLKLEIKNEPFSFFKNLNAGLNLIAGEKTGKDIESLVKKQHNGIPLSLFSN